jgi:DNA-binding MarR family transcriptional regulator
MTLGIVQTQLLNVAAQLDLADHLKNEPRSAVELAAATGMDPPTLSRLLAALVRIGIFAEPTPGQFSCTPTGALLQTDAFRSMRAVALTYGGEWFTHAWPRLIDSVRTGTSVFDSTFGMKAYAYFDTHPAARAVFQEAMSGISDEECVLMREHYDFSACRLAVDVGGGQGHVLRELLQAFPSLRAVLFDLPPVIESARQALQPFGDRCEFVAGDYGAGVPSGGDMYILKRILQSRTDAQAGTLLQHIRGAMVPGGRVLVAEPDANSLYGRLLDIHMLVNFGGRLRTDAELQSLLQQNGFTPGDTISTGSSTTLRLIDGRAA